MLDKLNALTDRFKELEEAIAQPDIIQNYEKYNIFIIKAPPMERLNTNCWSN